LARIMGRSLRAANPAKAVKAELRDVGAEHCGVGGQLR
jgi:hypothetical protein